MSFQTMPDIQIARSDGSGGMGLTGGILASADLGLPSADPPVCEGWGRAEGHHGELLQGVFEVQGRLNRGLVTLPCPLFSTAAHAQLIRQPGDLVVQPAWKSKALRAATATIEALNVGAVSGTISVQSNIAAGMGFGSSTSDVTATIRAVLDALNRRLSPEQIASIAVTAEGASDPLMFERTLLFAHRDGVVLEDFHVDAPPVEVVGFATRAEPVDTLELAPARYSSWEISCLRTLRGLLRRGVLTGDVAAIGRVAVASTRINQRFLSIDSLPRLLEIQREAGAAGIQVSHSGSIAGMLFDPEDPALTAKTALAVRRLAQLGIADIWRFHSARWGR